jgi:hypothetical protein
MLREIVADANVPPGGAAIRGEAVAERPGVLTCAFARESIVERPKKRFRLCSDAVWGPPASRMGVTSYTQALACFLQFFAAQFLGFRPLLTIIQERIDAVSDERVYP